MIEVKTSDSDAVVVFSGSFRGASSGAEPDEEGGGVTQCGQNPEGR